MCQKNMRKNMLTEIAGGAIMPSIMGLCEHRETSLSSVTERLARAVVSVGTFIHRYSRHEHDHDGAEEACSVCVQLAIARHVLNGLAHIAIALSALFAARNKRPAKMLPFCFLKPLTLISIKVQFNT
jgi:hypothetical protein